jgi:predicted RND superfamily exporter protein
MCLISFFGIKRIVIGDNARGTGYLRQDRPYNIAEGFINNNFGGTNSYFILVESAGSLLKADILRSMDALQGYILKEVPQAGSSLSIVQAIKALNMFMFDGKREFFIIPDNDDTIAQYWFLYTLSGFPYDYDHLINRQENIANIKFDLKDHKAKTVDLVVAKTREFLNSRRDFPATFSFAGGDIGIFYAINDIIKKTMFPNVLFISALIFFYMSFAYRSFIAGWILFLPLLFSNLLVFAMFGFMGTPITTDMLPLVSLSEGLGINYGIYILARFYDEMKQKRMTYRRVLFHTLITSGKAVFFSGFIVSLGIFVWVFSPILYQARLGVNLCFILILNMVASLVMIPVFVWWIKPRFLFGNVGVRLKRRRG